jgi:hypothetical protein
MAVINPDHLLDHARQLAGPPAVGAPRQVDLRRAISSCYYSVFHFTLTAVADAFVGNTKRATPEYALAYRSIDHRSLKDLCVDLQKATIPARYQPYTPPMGFGADFRAYAAGVVDLQQNRHAADYDPSSKFVASDAWLMVRTAESTIVSFRSVSDIEQRSFAALLLFGVRS